MLLNCGAWENSLRAPWTARWLNQSILKKSVPNIHWKDWYWSWTSNTLASWSEELTHLKKTLMLIKTEGRRQGRQIVGCYHQLDGLDFEQTRRYIEGQGSLACCSPWDHKESDMTEWLNNNNRLHILSVGMMPLVANRRLRKKKDWKSFVFWQRLVLWTTLLSTCPLFKWKVKIKSQVSSDEYGWTTIVQDF